MASISLYPPIVDSSMPAFLSGQSCNVKYSLSKFNSANEIKSIHISVVYQKSGINAIKKSDENGRYRSSGIIILNQSPSAIQGETNLYSININPFDLKNENGWETGEIYKVQLRFSSIEYPTSGEAMPEKWLNDNANSFSEWSTVCVVKPIGKITITIPMFNFNSNNIENDANEETEKTLYSTTLDFHGSYSCETLNEYLYSYQISLYQEGIINSIADSGILYANDYESSQFKYLFPIQLDNNTKYSLIFSFTTEHGYSETYTFNFNVAITTKDKTDFSIVTVDNNIQIEKEDINNDNHIYGQKSYFITENESTLESEEEEGRIGIKIFDAQDRQYSGNICIRRTDSKSNFTKWEDIKIIPIIQTATKDLDIFFDYTIESGIWYQYALQIVTKNIFTKELERSEMSTPSQPIIRNFNHSYLLGENGVQLKLKYDNTINNYKINISESKIDTIGGQYPFITRNGNSKYRTIPVNGLISFNMDDMHTFTNKIDIYKKETIVNAYNTYNNKNNIEQYDYFYERFFREKVLAFLHDGKPKLFKSTTEGNMILRLMDISSSPNQALSRMIYSFSSTGHEIAEATMENYLKYKFYTIGEAADSFAISQENIGQIIGDFTIGEQGENIIQRIIEKYDSQGKNYAGFTYTLTNIKYLRIEINSLPFRIKVDNTNDYAIGNKIQYGDKNIIIYGNTQQIYEFDPLLTFKKGDSIKFLGPDDNTSPGVVNATIDFVYEVVKDTYKGKQVTSRTLSNGLGQYYEHTNPNVSIYSSLFYKYYAEQKATFSRLTRLTSIEIEANPGAVFYIKDENDIETGQHEIGYTGILRLTNLSDIKDLQYIGLRQLDGTILKQSTDVLINYTYVLTKGEYLIQNE